jgi:hypothetical protein
MQVHVVPWQCMFVLSAPFKHLAKVFYFTLVVYDLGYVQTIIKRSKVSKEHYSVS